MVGANVTTERGLTSVEAQARLDRYGPNRLPEAMPVPWRVRAWAHPKSPIIYILLFALAFDVVVWISEGADGWPFGSIAILVILAFNTIMSVWQEYRAEDALARLEELAAPRVWVRRDGRFAEIPAAELVPGDLVRVEAGDRIPADGGLTGEQSLMVDESMPTGESVAIDRAVGEEVFSGRSRAAAPFRPVSPAGCIPSRPPFVLGWGVIGGTAGAVVGVLAFVPLLTGLIGWCPLYSVFRFRTNRDPRPGPAA